MTYTKTITLRARQHDDPFPGVLSNRLVIEAARELTVLRERQKGIYGYHGHPDNDVLLVLRALIRAAVSLPENPIDITVIDRFPGEPPSPGSGGDSCSP